MGDAVGVADADEPGEPPDDWPGEPEGLALGESHGGVQSTGVDVAVAEGLVLAAGLALSAAVAVLAGLLVEEPDGPAEGLGQGAGLHGSRTAP